jgi:hypothetical protein
VLLVETPKDGAERYAERVRRVLAAHAFTHGQQVTASFGVAGIPDDLGPSADIARAADEALYQAKRGGRNRVVAYQPRYLGGEEAQLPLSIEERERAGTPALGTRAAADFTPAPGTLFALASVTPAAGVPKLTLEPTAEVLTNAAAAVTEPPGAPSTGPAAGDPRRDEVA